MGVTCRACGTARAMDNTYSELTRSHEYCLASRSGIVGGAVIMGAGAVMGALTAGMADATAASPKAAA